MTSLLGHLAPLLAVHPENIATAALTFILENASARGAFERFLASCGSPSPNGLDYRRQDGGGGGEGGIPDIVGRDEHGHDQVLLEAKFWAGLTEHQPVSYLRRLRATGTLVFVVPTSRVDLVWGELVRRVSEAGFDVASTAKGEAFRMVKLSASNMLLVTWDALLRSVTDGVRQGGDPSLLEDLRQLEGLCTRMAKEGFTPLLPQELTSGLWRRVSQLSNLVADIGAALDAACLAKAEGRVSSGPGWTGLKMMMHDVVVVLYFDSESCHECFPTPFWLKLPSAARKHVIEFATREPRELFEDDGQPYLALPIRSGVEKADIVSDVVGRCRLVADRLQAAPASKVDDLDTGEGDPQGCPAPMESTRGPDSIKPEDKLV